MSQANTSLCQNSLFFGFSIIGFGFSLAALVALAGVASKSASLATFPKLGPARLLEAAYECLLDGGYAATTVGHVQQRAGVARGTLLHHFPTRGALMAGVVLAETNIREDVEERFFSFRDVFAALFFFVFGLSIAATIASNGTGLASIMAMLPRWRSPWPRRTC